MSPVFLAGCLHEPVQDKRLGRGATVAGGDKHVWERRLPQQRAGAWSGSWSSGGRGVWEDQEKRSREQSMT